MKKRKTHNKIQKTVTRELIYYLITLKNTVGVAISLAFIVPLLFVVNNVFTLKNNSSNLDLNDYITAAVVLGILGTLGQLCFAASNGLLNERKKSFNIAGEQLIYSIVLFSSAFGFKFIEILNLNRDQDLVLIGRILSVLFFLFAIILVSLAIHGINKLMISHIFSDELLNSFSEHKNKYPGVKNG